MLRLRALLPSRKKERLKKHALKGRQDVDAEHATALKAKQEAEGMCSALSVEVVKVKSALKERDEQIAALALQVRGL